LDTSGSRSEIAGQFTNVVLDKYGKDQLDRSCEKFRSVTKSQEEEKYPTRNKKEGMLIGLVTTCTLLREEQKQEYE
jgi:hypothetical protein